MDLRERQKVKLAKIADVATKWIGSIESLLVHTALFIFSFSLSLAGIVNFERMLLVLTTIVSLEAIYLSIFIQMSVNKNSQDIEIIQEDVGEIQEDIEDIEEDISEIQKDVDEINEDVGEIQEDIEEIEEGIDEIQKDVDEINEEGEEGETIEKKEAAALATIQAILLKLEKEIEVLKKK